MSVAAVAIILIHLYIAIAQVKIRVEDRRYLEAALVFVVSCTTIGIYILGNVWVWATWVMMRIGRIMLWPTEAEIESQSRTPQGIFAIVMIALILGSATSFGLFQYLR